MIDIVHQYYDINNHSKMATSSHLRCTILGLFLTLISMDLSAAGTPGYVDRGDTKGKMEI